MAKTPEALYAFNRGIISALAAARVDLKRTALSAEIQTNFVPRVLGSMSLRPGLKYILGSYTASRHIPFVFAIDDTALLEISLNQMRVIVNDALITRAAVTTAIVNPDLSGGGASWTDLDEGVATSTHVATGTGYFLLRGTGTQAAIRGQTVAVPAGSIGVRHALRIVVTWGYATFRVGSTLGGAEVLEETTLHAGVHSITFTPAVGTIYVQMLNREVRPCWVDSIVIEGSGALALPTLWATTGNLNDLRFEQSADVVYVACHGVKQARIERRDNESWSIADYTPDDGPFKLSNNTKTTLTSLGYTGITTINASKPIFESAHVGALFRISHAGQRVGANLAALNAVTSEVRITGTGTARNLTIATTFSAWTGTLTLQRSVGEIGLWEDVVAVVGPVVYNDTFDNQIIYYRLKITAYTTGSVDVVMSTPFGFTTGVCRVYGYTSGSMVSALVIKPFSAVTASEDWAEGEWSGVRGYPSAVALHDGRLGWAGKDKIWESISDDYNSFDDEVAGDSGTIARSVGKGPIDKFRWLLSAEHQIIGGQMAEHVVRSSSLDEPITPTNFGIKSYTGRGSGSVSGVIVDSSVLFTDRSEKRVFELQGDVNGRYVAIEMTALAPEVCQPAVTRMVVQRLPDTRVHCVLSDGTAAIIVYDKVEEVKCWIKIETDGLITDAVVLPDTSGEDQVYYKVQRTVGGGPAYFLEKWAKESECVGGVLNKQADAFVSYTGAATAVITGLTHLEGRTVVCWADGVDKGTFVVSGGSITLPGAVTNAVVGLTYRARFKSMKLGYVLQGNPSLTNHQKQRIDHVSFMLLNTHAQGLKYGTDFDYLDDLPAYEDGALVGADTVHATYDEDPVELNGTIDTNTRLCLEANAPRPCTVVAAIITTVA